MRKIHKLKTVESGQMMVLVVLMIFVLAGMIALILDGGAIMSNRRTAQAAADAGALAGAQRVCYGYTDGESVAEYYAINKNGASSAEVSITGYSVTVQATVENESFFAKIFGVDTLTSVAEATSGCYGPRGKSVVPLAWNCRAPSVGEPGPYPEEYGCEVQTLDWQEVLRPLVEGEVATQDISDYDDNVQTYEMNGFNVVNSAGVPPEQIYIIYDSDKICVEDDPVSGALQCDLDGDGKKDIQIGGDRGWLYLTADTSSIGDWVDDGPHPDILLQSHIWLSGKSGVDTSVIIKMANNGFAGEVVLIPVYNVICEGDPRDDASCVAEAHATPPWPPFFGEDNMDEIRNGTLNYHILTFEPFYITCVSKSGDCPGFRYAQTLPKGEELKDGPVIEGFFLSNVGVTPDTSQGCDINLGNCVISLSN